MRIRPNIAIIYVRLCLYGLPRETELKPKPAQVQPEPEYRVSLNLLKLGSNLGSEPKLGPQTTTCIE